MPRIGLPGAFKVSEAGVYGCVHNRHYKCDLSACWFIATGIDNDSVCHNTRLMQVPD